MKFLEMTWQKSRWLEWLKRVSVHTFWKFSMIGIAITRWTRNSVWSMLCCGNLAGRIIDDDFQTSNVTMTFLVSNVLASNLASGMMITMFLASHEKNEILAVLTKMLLWSWWQSSCHLGNGTSWCLGSRWSWQQGSCLASRVQPEQARSNTKGR